MKSWNPEIIVIGGGAAGFFAAITCAEENPSARVRILERSNTVLQKVKVSGGGRCNVTHHCFDARELTRNYPRGARELLAPFLRFGPEQTVAWFEARGVPLKTEADGRMFPVTDDSQTIVDCLWQSARRAGVVVETGVRVEGLQREGKRWKIAVTGQEPVFADKVMVATGSNEQVWQWLAGLGHRIVPPVPSLFTFNIKDPRLRELLGISVPEAVLEIPALKLKSAGPLLITHWGLSGPAVLRLSAWGARQLHACKYQCQLEVNWTGLPKPEVTQILAGQKQESGRKQVQANPLFGLPQRLWQRLTAAAGIAETARWADMDKKTLQGLTAELASGVYQINGKSTFKEEFVTAGGVDLREVDFKTFSSKIHPGLYLAGEVLDIDAITGGFNFQAAWTGGWVAGKAMGEG